MLLSQGVLQFLEHKRRNILEVVLGELVEVDDLVHAVDKLGPQEVLQGLHGPLLALLLGGAVKANAAHLGIAARVGGHDDDGVLKVHLAAVGVGDMAVVQNLQENIEHVGVGLLDLVKEDHGVGFAADLLGELARLIIAHIARGRADDAGDGVLLHKLGHVQPDEGFRGVEQVLGQLLDQLGLTHAGGAHEDKGYRLMLGADAHTTTADGGGDCLYRLVLADDVLFQSLFQLGELFILLFPDLAGGDIGPKLDHIGQMFHL